jgi:hypothetical protein
MGSHQPLGMALMPAHASVLSHRQHGMRFHRAAVVERAEEKGQEPGPRKPHRGDLTGL